MNRNELNYLNKTINKYEKQLKKEGKTVTQEFSNLHHIVLTKISEMNEKEYGGKLS